MKFLKENKHWNWKADDPAGLYFDHTADDAEPPKVINCMRIGHHGLVTPPIVPVETAELEFLAAAEFGEARDKKQTGAGWTGDSYKYAIYTRAPRFGREEIVIIRTDGGGTYFYLDNTLTASSMWRHLAQVCPPERLWDVCQTICHTWTLANDAGRSEVFQLFLHDRLKKRRRNGKVYAEVTAPKMMRVTVPPVYEQKAIGTPITYEPE